jgi:hypothetical protein
MIEQILKQHLNRSSLHIQVKTQDQQLQVFLESDAVPNVQLAAQVYKILKQLDLQDIETIRVYGLRSGARQVAWRQTFPWSYLTLDDRDFYSFNNRWVTGLSLPLSIAFGWLSNSIDLLKLLFTGMRIWIHEWGHATAAWLAGHQAIPLPFGFTPIAAERSLFVYFGVLFLLGVTIWTGWRESKRWVMGVAIGLGLVQFWMTWVLSRETALMWFSFAGVGGEFYLSTLLMVSFYFPLPQRFRWDFWRYVLLLPAANCFWHIFGLWRKIRQGTAEIPWGSLFGGAGDSNGDMNQLNEVYSWSIAQIISTYNHIGNLCLFVLMGVYVFFVIKQNRLTLKQLGFWRD